MKFQEAVTVFETYSDLDIQDRQNLLVAYPDLKDEQVVRWALQQAKWRHDRFKQGRAEESDLDDMARYASAAFSLARAMNNRELCVEACDMLVDYWSQARDKEPESLWRLTAKAYRQSLIADEMIDEVLHLILSDEIPTKCLHFIFSSADLFEELFEQNSIGLIMPILRSQDENRVALGMVYLALLYKEGAESQAAKEEINRAKARFSYSKLIFNASALALMMYESDAEIDAMLKRKVEPATYIFMKYSNSLRMPAETYSDLETKNLFRTQLRRVIYGLILTIAEKK
jgi:hypothetical protein